MIQIGNEAVAATLCRRLSGHSALKQRLSHVTGSGCRDRAARIEWDLSKRCAPHRSHNSSVITLGEVSLIDHPPIPSHSHALKAVSRLSMSTTHAPEGPTSESFGCRYRLDFLTRPLLIRHWTPCTGWYSTRRRAKRNGCCPLFPAVPMCHRGRAETNKIMYYSVQ
jgi:hypothetical protein